MKLKSTLLALGMMLPASVFATDYYIRTAANGTGDGSSWDNAMAFETFYTDFQNKDKFASGDAFYFAEGTYVVPEVSVATQVAKAFTFKGGYPETLTGTELPDVDYSAHRTIISGDRNGDGKQNAGDARCLFALQANTTSTTNPQRPILIQGIDFCYVYTSEPTSDNANRKGALCIDNSGDVTIKNCRFYNNEIASEGSAIGGAALLNYRSTVHLIDCEFTNNKAKSRGAAIRVASNAGTKGHLIVERCLFAGNEVTNNNGSAIFVQHSPVVTIVNSTIVDNKGTEAVYIGAPDANYKRVLNIISSTIANNAGGNQVKMVAGNIANSIIVGCAGAEADAADAIAVTGGDAAIVSGGNNVLETSSVAITTTETDVNLAKENAYATVFGTNVLTDGVLVPVYKATGALADALATTVAEWGVEGVDLTVDQNGTVRGETVPGAVKADIKDAISSVEVADKADDAYYYTLSGIRVATPQKGIFIKNGKKVIIK